MIKTAKGKWVKTRIAPEDYKKIRKLAIDKEVSLAELLREALRTLAEEIEMPYKRKESEKEHKLVATLLSPAEHESLKTLALMQNITITKAAEAAIKYYLNYKGIAE